MSYYSKMASPVGELTLLASERGPAAVLWPNEMARIRLGPITEDPLHPVLIETERQLRAYFAGELKQFTVPLDFVGTEFQKRCGRRWSLFPMAKRAATARLRAPSVILPPSGR